MKDMRARIFSARTRTIAAAVVVVCALTGCTSTSAKQQSEAGEEWSAAAGLPAVTGGFGETPKVSPGEGTAPKELQKRVLVKGDGAEVKADDILRVNYAGQLWDGKQFDTSFGKSPAVFSLNGVVKGWKQGLTGTHVGDRVQLTIPPQLGYGERGAGASIPPHSTLVFIVDVLGNVDSGDLSALRDAKLLSEAELPKGLSISGKLGAEPKIEVSELSMPEKSQRIVLAEGKGRPISPEDTVIVHQTLFDLKNKTQVTSYGKEAISSQLPISANPQLLEMFTGLRIGSRFAYLMPAVKNSDQAAEQPARVIVMDVVGALGGEK